MALYDGFFDAVQDENTGEYDRTYSSGDFTGYFANVIGSGVCVHSNPDSFKAEYEDGTLYLRPGYLFIQGYWLANKAAGGETDYKGYAVTLPANMTGPMAVVAHLNLGQRLIEIEVRAVSQAYPDALVLAIITASTAEDTRRNTDICGIIDTAGELSGKVEWALNYIDTEIESKLQQVEQDITAQDAKLDAKIAEVQAVADSIVPPPIGSIKLSASQNVDETWLKCDGRFVSETDYPELVAALGKLIPSGDKFQLISSGEIGPQISNGVLYGGRLWVYSYSTRKLYGVDLNGAGSVKEISITSDDSFFAGVHAPTIQQPIALSLVKSPVDSKTRLFLAQILKDGNLFTTAASESRDVFWIYTAEFTETVTSIKVSPAFTSCARADSDYGLIQSNRSVPFVVSWPENGSEVFGCVVGLSSHVSISGTNYVFSGVYVEWSGQSGSALLKIMRKVNATSTLFSDCQRIGYDPKNKNEAVLVMAYEIRTSTLTSPPTVRVLSHKNGLYSREAYSNRIETDESISVPAGLNVVGRDKMLFGVSKTNAMSISLTDLDAPQIISTNLRLPSAARIFVDGSAYLWGKDIYMIFVGTGIIFSRTLEEGDFGYLDTTSVLGTITQFGYLDYSQDEGTLYLLGQDTTNTVKVAKIVLNTLYDYANDGAWLPMIASDGVPAYIRAKETGGGGVITDPADMQIKISFDDRFASVAKILFNGEALQVAGSFTRVVSASGTFTISLQIEERYNTAYTPKIKLNGTTIITASENEVGAIKSATFKVSDYISGGIELVGATS